MSERLLLVRHGLTEWNRDGRFQGHLDPALSSEGRTQASLLAARLAAEPSDIPSRIVSSPLLRALQTAETIADAAAVPRGLVVPDRGLMELGQGAWEGRTHAELAASDPERYSAWRAASGSWHAPPDGEAAEDAGERVRVALDHAIEASDLDGAWPLCVVGHGGSLRLAAGLLLDLEPAHSWALELDNASLSILERDAGAWRLVTWNDVSHLLGRAVQHAGEEDGEPLAL